MQHFFVSRFGGVCPFTGHLDIVKYLVAHNAEINLANVYNNTCLMISAYKGHTDVVEFLLSNGADPDQQALCGATALHYAAECGHVDICAILLDYGATLKRNEFDMTAVTTAAERTRELVVELFYSRPGLLTKEKVKYSFFIGEFSRSAVWMALLSSKMSLSLDVSRLISCLKYYVSCSGTVFFVSIIHSLAFHIAVRMSESQKA